MDVTICLNVTRQKKIIIYLDFNAKKEKKNNHEISRRKLNCLLRLITLPSPTHEHTIHHFHNVQKSRVDHHRSFRSFAHLLVSARNFRQETNTNVFTRTVENRGFLHASRFETDPNLPHFRAITAQPHLFYLFLLSRRIETPSSFPVSTETDPAGTSNEANRSGHDSQPRVSTLVTRSTKEKLTEEAQGNNGREGRREGRKGAEE